MKDDRIIELLFERDESGLRAAEEKYSDICHVVASNILNSREDCEECLNDTLLAVWQSIPPESPQSLRAYMTRIIRNLALKRSRDTNVWKRRANVQMVGDELLAIIPDGTDLAVEYESKRIGEILNSFLEKSPQKEREIFVMRYWFNESIAGISENAGFSESKTKSLLMRMRGRLAEELRKEGILP